MFVTARSKAIGLVFDVSLRHLEDRRIIDVVKKQSAEWIGKTLEDSEDAFYLYHPEVVQPTWRRGESMSSIANYSTEGWLGDLQTALVQTFWVIAGQDLDAYRCLILITDRIQDLAPIRKLSLLERREQTNIEFILIGIGKYYQKRVLDGASVLLPSAKIIHLSSPTEIAACLAENNG
jgi:hypothetical protein